MNKINRISWRFFRINTQSLSAFFAISTLLACQAPHDAGAFRTMRGGPSAVKTQADGNNNGGLYGFEAVPAPLTFPAISKSGLRPLRCASNKTCPAAIGELITMSPLGIEYCTATLISSNEIITASHCLPWMSLSDDQTFHDNCWVRFPASPLGSQIGKFETNELGFETFTACARILKATQVNTADKSRLQPDYAIIQLKGRVGDRLPLDFHVSSKIDKKAMALIYGVNPQENAHVIEFMNCSRNDHFTIPDISHDEDEMLLLPDCAIKKGFSGGPILDSLSREVIGVISGVIGGTIGPDPQKPVKKPTAIGTKVNRPFLSIENASTEFD